MRGYEEGSYPWNDAGTGVEREYLRNWRGMPLRTDWNAGPLRRNCRTCTSCGYRWDDVDFTYRGAVLVNGEPAPVMLHKICWNCFMCETQPHQVRKHWEAVDRSSSGTPAARKETPRLKTLGDQ